MSEELSGTELQIGMALTVKDNPESVENYGGALGETSTLTSAEYSCLVRAGPESS